MFKPITGLPYYIPLMTEVPATDLRRARKVYRGLDESCYKLASHKDDPTETLYIWQVGSDNSAWTVDDDASHLARPENEGIFEMRCDDLDLDMRAEMAGYWS